MPLLAITAVSGTTSCSPPCSSERTDFVPENSTDRDPLRSNENRKATFPASPPTRRLVTVTSRSVRSGPDPKSWTAAGACRAVKVRGQPPNAAAVPPGRTEMWRS